VIYINDDYNIEQIKFLRILWCDNANLIRSKALRMKKKQDLLVGISAGQLAVPVMYDGIVDDAGFGPVGEVYLKADTETITPLPYSPGHARAMGDMTLNGKTWECCPRGFLKKMINKLKDLDLTLKASFENEFYLLDTDGSPVDETFFSSTQSLDMHKSLMEDVVEALELQNLTVEQFYSEAGPGQMELTIKYSDPLKAADSQIIYRETIRAIAFKHGHITSFLPKIFSGKSGSGCHLHLSLWRDGKNITGMKNGGISNLTSHFIAGILHHLPSLMAVTTPTTNSYRRIIPRNWAGAYQCWGYDNREAAVRVVTDPEGFNSQFEFKTVDATSNPYLALGCVIAAGIDGIKQKIDLPDPIQKDPASVELDVPRLPKSLDKSLASLKNDKILLDALGHDLSRAYLAVKKAEWDVTKKMCLKEEVKLLKNKY
jgi:glutamine synthetase